MAWCPLNRHRLQNTHHETSQICSSAILEGLHWDGGGQSRCFPYQHCWHLWCGSTSPLTRATLSPQGLKPGLRLCNCVLSAEIRLAQTHGRLSTDRSTPPSPMTMEIWKTSSTSSTFPAREHLARPPVPLARPVHALSPHSSRSSALLPYFRLSGPQSAGH